MQENQETQQSQFQNITFTDSFEGTARQFEEAGVTLNGNALKQIAVNSLGDHALIETNGFLKRPEGSKGRAPKLYKAVSRPGFQLGIIQKTDTQA